MLLPVRAVFLDRDGVLNKEVGHLSSAQDLQLLPGVPEAIKRLNHLDIPAIVVTNQSVVARGICTEKQVVEIHSKIAQMLAQDRASITQFKYCPHHPTEGIGRYQLDCQCRKPKPGMLFDTAEELNIDLSNSVIVGDQITDLQAGWNAGCQAVLVSTGYGQITKGKMASMERQPDYFAENLPEAVDWILRTFASNQVW